MVGKAQRTVVQLCAMFETAIGTQQTKHLYNIFTMVKDNGPTLYKCYTNVLCLLGSGFIVNIFVCYHCQLFYRLPDFCTNYLNYCDFILHKTNYTAHPRHC